MAIHDRYISEHFNYFNDSFQEFTGLRPHTQHLQGQDRIFIYVCPLCLERHMGAQGNTLHTIGTFTKDHYPPKSVGGHKTILVCDKCNSTAGSEFDYILEQWLRYRAFEKRIPGAKAPMLDTTISTIPDKKYKGLLTVDDNENVEIDVQPNKSYTNPILAKWVAESKTNHNYTITFTARQPLPEILAKALLKTAYLHCFVAWGYQFVLSEQAQMIREVLDGLREYPLPAGYLAILDNDPGLAEGLIFVESPKEWQALAVNIPLLAPDLPYKCQLIVPIPAPTKTGWEDLSRLKEWVGKESDQVDVKLVPLPPYLAAGTLNGYTQSWADHYKP